MSLLNLGLAELIGLLGATSALVVALYLLNRARKRETVPTLRFWVQAVRSDAARRRRRIQQPWSLVLQLIGIALLLLAIAQPRLGSAGGWSRDHILVLDTSSWMAAGTRTRTLMDEAKEAARAYLARVPAADRVMLVRADGLPAPATPLTSDREIVRRAIEQSRPSAAALN
ncbi:MAG TPA: VWA domain-containing protein, partial [Bryobacteraceae bacterium]|nr:VWA domain-containing protein [Bryobacteraceae bacterium]